jgi:protease I
MVVPGGFAPDFMRRSPEVLKFANDMVTAGKVLAAICHGGWLLCSTQAYKGKKATCFMAIKDDIINAGAEYIDAECVVDGNLITSRKPDDLPAFCAAIIEALNRPE